MFLQLPSVCALCMWTDRRSGVVVCLSWLYASSRATGILAQEPSLWSVCWHLANMIMLDVAPDKFVPALLNDYFVKHC